MVFAEPTFAGVPLSLFRQLPAGVTVTLAGAGGQAPIISLTDPAALLPMSLMAPPPAPAPSLLGNINFQGAGPGIDTFTPSNALLNNAAPAVAAPGGINLLRLAGDDDDFELDDDRFELDLDDKKGPGKGLGRKIGGIIGGVVEGVVGGVVDALPFGIGKKLSKGKGLPPGLAKRNIFQTGAAALSAPSSTPLAMAAQAPVASNTVQQSPSLLPTAAQALASQPVAPPALASQVPVPPSPFQTALAAPQSIPGLPGPTLALSPQPGPIIQLGPPFPPIRL